MSLSSGNYEFSNKTFENVRLINVSDDENINYISENYNNPEYELPLEEMPINYIRDIKGKFNLNLNENETQTLLDNGVVIIPGDTLGQKYNKFEDAYEHMSNSRGPNQSWITRYNEDRSGVPIIITTDSVLNLFHIEFNEILKNLEINELSDLLDKFLSKSINESYKQYESLEDPLNKELSKRNLAYLSVALKLLDPSYNVKSMVKEDVDKEIGRIKAHKGFYKNELFSKDCPNVCSNVLYLKNDNSCSSEIKVKVIYNEEEVEFVDLYNDVCSKKCYCEDYSQYIPRGHYTSTEELKNYFKSMMWLGRITFKTNGENWTKQALLLSEAVKSADIDDEWNKVYSVTSFFSGVSDDLSFYDYDMALNNIIEDSSDSNISKEDIISDEELFNNIQEELSEMKGPKILNNFEFDLSGSLEETTKGMRLIGQRYAIDSQILGDMVYRNVGPNIDNSDYNDILNFGEINSILSQPVDFYKSCESMDANKQKYWNEVCESAMVYYCGYNCNLEYNDPKLQKVYNSCRFMPTGLDIMSSLGSNSADEIISDLNYNSFCNYSNQLNSSKNLVDSYTVSDWTDNLYNSWLWVLQPIVKDKPIGYPNWMRSKVWEKKDLITALGSWAQLRHDTILYVKQSYTSRTSCGAMGPLSSKYYGYVEPNPEAYFRLKKTLELLKNGLEEKELLSNKLKEPIDDSINLVSRLEEISKKELKNTELSEEDYDYIESISVSLTDILEKLASALTVKVGKSGIGSISSTRLSTEDDPFNTQIIADVHTEGNTSKVLEVGTGRIDWIIVAHKSKDGSIGLAVGPMFSYYEFPWDMDDRLTDEKWRSSSENLSELVGRPNYLYD